VVLAFFCRPKTPSLAGNQEEELKNISLGSDDDDSGEEAAKKYVLGKVDYVAQKPTQVSYSRGARILVLGEPEGGWFRGRLESTYEVRR
jgi:hypothetical protein